MFIDIHAHVSRRAGMPRSGRREFATPEQLIARYDDLGIDQGVLLPLVSPEVYEPQPNADILEIVDRYPGRFIPFCNLDPRAIRNAADAPLGDLLAYYRERGCKGIGEVTANLPFLDPLVQNLFRHAEAAGLPLTFHIATRAGHGYGLIDAPGLPGLERCLQAFPKLRFLGHSVAFWAEISRLDTPNDRNTYPAYPVRPGGVLPILMRRYPNLLGDLSAGSGHTALARDPEHAARFLTEFQDRLLFGTDITYPDTKVPLAEFLTGLRDRGAIAPTVFQKVARDNARRLLGLAP